MSTGWPIEPARAGRQNPMGGRMSEGAVVLLERVRLPKRHWHTQLSKIPDYCPHKRVISQWISDLERNVRTAKGLLLVGEYSTGKSGCAAIMLKAAAMRGIIGLWIRARDLPQFVIEKTPFDEELLMIDRVCQVPLLIIDEVQIRDDIAYSEQAVENVIRKRLDDEKCTILTTNHKVVDLKTKYRALTEALKETVYPVVVSGFDFRSERAKEIDCVG